jgi:succinate-semialdehyde dehydrogenase/glutarate-semialdehyde dehydrogenase
MTASTAYPNVQLLINNEWRAARSGATLPVHNPADGSVVGTVAKASIADLDDALAAAAKGFEVWKNTPAVERSKIMRAAAALLRERTDAIATMMTLEQGKPLGEAKVEIGMSVDIIEWFAEEGRRVYGRIVSPRSMSQQQMVLKEPVGPVAAFTPWNFPINQVVRKLCGALATGCSMIVKAAEETPASPAELIRAFVDAGLPPGVVGLVYGDPAEISNYLIPHPVIRKITFTGSTPVGKMLASLAGKHMKRLTMELGGHAPVIVAADANIAHAVKVIAGAKFRNAGQVCISPTRFLVEEAARDEFVAGFVAYTQGLKVGSGLEKGINMGPLGRHRRRAYRHHGQFLPAHGAARPATRQFGVQQRAVRPNGRRAHGEKSRRSNRRSQPPAIRPVRVRVHQQHQERTPAFKPSANRHALDQPARRPVGRAAIRRRQGLRLRL